MISIFSALNNMGWHILDQMAIFVLLPLLIMTQNTHTLNTHTPPTYNTHVPNTPTYYHTHPTTYTFVHTPHTPFFLSGILKLGLLGELEK